MFFVNFLKKEKSLTQLLTSNLIITLLGLIGGIIIAKYMTLEERGEVGTIFIWATFGVSLIFSGTVEYYYKAKKNTKFFVSKSILFVYIMLSILLSCIFFYFQKIESYVWYVFLFIPLNIYCAYKLAEINIFGKLNIISYAKIIQPLIYVLSLIVLIFLEICNVKNILIINLVSNFILFIYLFYRDNNNNIEKDDQLFLGKEWFLVNISTIVGVFLSQFDKLFVSANYTTSDIALYLVSSSIILAPLGIIGQSMSTYLISELTDSKFWFYLVGYMIITTFVSLTIYIATPYLLYFLFETKYEKINDIIIYMLLYGVILNYRIVLCRIKRVLGQNKIILFSDVFLVTAIAVFCMIREYLELIHFLLSYSLAMVISILILFKR